MEATCSGNSEPLWALFHIFLYTVDAHFSVNTDNGCIRFAACKSMWCYLETILFLSS